MATMEEEGDMIREVVGGSIVLEEQEEQEECERDISYDSMILTRNAEDTKKSKAKSRTAMNNHVGKMLKKHTMIYEGVQIRKLEDVPEKIFNDNACEFIQKFSTYIYDCPTIKTWNAHKANVSALHVYIVDISPQPA